MTTARHLSLVHSDADVIPLPRTVVEHNALRHAVLREARDGRIQRDRERITINGLAAAKPTRDAIGDLETAGCIAWTGEREARQTAGITTAGRRQLATWERRGSRPSRDGGGDAA